MKTCTRCKLDLTNEDFPLVNKKTGKISSVCGNCKREYDRVYWENNKLIKSENKNKLRRENRLEKRKYIIDILQLSHCMDCKNSDWRILQFDHRDREEKSFNISDSLSYSIETIQSEIDKCDIVCANCHTLRTIEQLGYYKFLI